MWWTIGEIVHIDGSSIPPCWRLRLDVAGGGIAEYVNQVAVRIVVTLKTTSSAYNDRLIRCLGISVKCAITTYLSFC